MSGDEDEPSPWAKTLNVVPYHLGQKNEELAYTRRKEIMIMISVARTQQWRMIMVADERKTEKTVADAISAAKAAVSDLEHLLPSDPQVEAVAELLRQLDDRLFPA